LSKEQEIRTFIKHIEAITSSKVIGFDFIALGDDDGYFYQDYLLHSKQEDAYLKFLDEKYFNSNPSLLLTGLKEKIKSVNPSSSNDSKRIRLTYNDPKIPKDNFTKETALKKANAYYWNTWCKIISEFYPQCKSIYFIKEGFNNLVQTTALFIYFNSDLSVLDKRYKDWLTKASKIFLYEEAVSVFLPKHIEKLEELQRLKTKTMFSLTTHSLKTHLDTGVIKLKNAFKEKLSSYPTLLYEFNELDEETEELLKLTSLLSLIDKIDDEIEFIKEAKKSNLLTTNHTDYNLSEHIIKFNSRHAAMPDVEIKSAIGIEKLSLSLPIFGMYLSSRLLNLFFNTLFENVVSHGKIYNNKVTLTIEMETGCWSFLNETEDAITTFDPTKIKGNLRLFKLLIEETNSGSFLIDTSQKYKFKIEIKVQRHE